MQEKIMLPFHIKFNIYSNDLFLINGLGILIAISFAFTMVDEIAERMDFFTILPIISIVVFGFFRSYNRIYGIENSDIITKGILIEELILPRLFEKNDRHFVIRLTMKIEQIEQRFYWISKIGPIGFNNYQIIYNRSNPYKLILFDSLPLKTKKFLKEHQSTIANTQ